MTGALLVSSLLSVFSALAAQPPAWSTVSNEDGVLLERQTVEGSGFERLRVTLVIDAPVDVVAALHWGDGKLDDATGNVSSREVLVDKPNERVTYETAAAPLVSTRDYVIRFTRTHDAATGVRALSFRTVEHAARPPREGVVRIPLIEGGTVIAPVDGKPNASRVVHTVFSDAGGSIPAWIATNGQRDAVLKQMKALRARAVKPASSAR